MADGNRSTKVQSKKQQLKKKKAKPSESTANSPSDHPHPLPDSSTDEHHPEEKETQSREADSTQITDPHFPQDTSKDEHHSQETTPSEEGNSSPPRTKTFRCENCNKAFHFRESRQRHMKKCQGGHACDICDKICPSVSLLARHKDTHADSKQFQCPECFRYFKHQINYNQHRKLHSGEGTLYTCHVCEKVFTDKGHLKTHLDTHSSVPLYKCRECGKQYKNLMMLKQHRKMHTQENISICSFCGLMFPMPSKLETHVREKHSQVSSYKCTYGCENVYKSYRALRRHVVVVHLKYTAHTCEACGKICQSAHALRYHQDTHDTTAVHRCEVCGEEFSRLRHLDEHSKLHLGHTLLQCEQCDQSFPIQSQLDRHRDIHTTIPLYPCAMCPRKFKHKRNLQRHVKEHATDKHECGKCGRKCRTRQLMQKHIAMVHSNQPRYKCTGCTKVFSRALELKQHKDANACETHHECKICLKVFSTAIKLKDHAYVHAEKAEYQCDICPKMFKRKGSLIFHMKLHSNSALKCSQCSKRFATKQHLQIHMAKHSDSCPFTCSICFKRFRHRLSMIKHEKAHLKPETKLDDCSKFQAAKSPPSVKVPKKSIKKSKVFRPSGTDTCTSYSKSDQIEVKTSKTSLQNKESDLKETQACKVTLTRLSEKSFSQVQEPKNKAPAEPDQEIVLSQEKIILKSKESEPKDTHECSVKLTRLSDESFLEEPKAETAFQSFKEVLLSKEKLNPNSKLEEKSKPGTHHPHVLKSHEYRSDYIQKNGSRLSEKALSHDLIKSLVTCEKPLGLPTSSTEKSNLKRGPSSNSLESAFYGIFAQKRVCLQEDTDSKNILGTVTVVAEPITSSGLQTVSEKQKETDSCKDSLESRFYGKFASRVIKVGSNVDVHVPEQGPFSEDKPVLVLPNSLNTTHYGPLTIKTSFRSNPCPTMSQGLPSIDQHSGSCVKRISNVEPTSTSDSPYTPAKCSLCETHTPGLSVCVHQKELRVVLSPVEMSHRSKPTALRMDKPGPMCSVLSPPLSDRCCDSDRPLLSPGSTVNAESMPSPGCQFPCMCRNRSPVKEVATQTDTGNMGACS